MKKSLIVAGIITLMAIAVGCGGVQRDPGREYMPDMKYSRALETYASTEQLKEKGVNYNALPVAGTVARGDMFPYTLPNDSNGYNQSALVKDPLEPLDASYMKEAQRLYLVNCAICHGTKLDGNGPLYNGGNGPYPAAPKNLMGDEIKGKADGTLFHVMTFGKGQMGSYASQVNPKQRWMIVQYIRSAQKGTGAKDSTAVIKKDSTTAVPK